MLSDVLTYSRVLLDSNRPPIDELTLDSRLKVWVLLPISVVMVLAGLLRTQIMTLISPKVRGNARVKLTESQYVTKAQMLLANGSNLTPESFELRREYWVNLLSEGRYVAQVNTQPSNEPSNPFSDPQMSDGLMNMAKGNMANFIPQTLIMWWVNHFFAGFVLMKLPFPLTTRFKEMLQSGIMTNDLDVRWVSSISWYFISVLGLNPLYNLLNAENSDESMLPVPDQTLSNGPASPQPTTIMQNIANDWKIFKHESCLENVEKRVMEKYLSDTIANSK